MPLLIITVVKNPLWFTAGTPLTQISTENNRILWNQIVLASSSKTLLFFIVFCDKYDLQGGPTWLRTKLVKGSIGNVKDVLLRSALRFSCIPSSLQTSTLLCVKNLQAICGGCVLTCPGWAVGVCVCVCAGVFVCALGGGKVVVVVGGGLFGDQLRKRHTRPHSSPTLQNQLWSTGSGAPVSLLLPLQCDDADIWPSMGRQMKANLLIWSLRAWEQKTTAWKKLKKKALKKHICYLFSFLFVLILCSWGSSGQFFYFQFTGDPHDDKMLFYFFISHAQPTLCCCSHGNSHDNRTGPNCFVFHSHLLYIMWKLGIVLEKKTKKNTILSTKIKMIIQPKCLWEETNFYSAASFWQHLTDRGC